MKGNKQMQMKRRIIGLCVLAMIGNNTCAALDTTRADVPSGTELTQTELQIQDSKSEQYLEKEQGTEDGTTTEDSAQPELQPDPEPGTESEEPNLSQPNPEPEQSPGLGGVVTPEPNPETPDISPYTVTLDSCTIGAGETREYTTVSSQFAGASLPEGYYAGELTVEITGTVTIASGGCLSIGTLSVGSDAEASPVIRGTLSDAGLIVVKAGGCLKLTCAEVDLTGTGILIIQEPGASVDLTATTLDDNLIAWAAPTVDNQHDQPDEVWLQSGIPLTADALPKTLRTNLQYLDSEERMDIDVMWDLSGYDGRTSGTLQLNGTFIDAEGQELASVVPLTITVGWYEPERIVVTDTKWYGATACSAGLVVVSLPENSTVWGEVSSDGTTWSRWPEFEVLTDDGGIKTCMFFETEPTPQSYYRVAAQDHDTMRILISDAFLLPEEIGEDQGGNRGGSTAYHPPARYPSTVTSTEDSEESQASESEETVSPADLSKLKELLGLNGLLSTIEVPDLTDPLLSVSEEETEEPEAPVQVTSATSVLLKGESLAKQPAPVPVWREIVQNERAQDTETNPQTQTITAESASDLPQAETQEEELQTETKSENVQTVIAQPEQPAAEQVIEEEKASRLPYVTQILLTVVGLIVCAVIGMTVAGVGPLRKKKK